MWLDILFFQAVNNLAGQDGELDAIGIFLAVFLLPLLFFLVLPAAFSIKRLPEEHWWEFIVKAGVAAGLAYFLRIILGMIILRPRPFEFLPDVNQLIVTEGLQSSFPSGHAAIAFALAFSVYFADRTWGVSFLIIALLISLGRIFVGVHYPFDIVGGFLIGLLAVWIVRVVERKEWGKIGRALHTR